MAESIGGQAVIEGVMMRNKNILAVAVRNEKGKIILKKEKIKTYYAQKIPFVRGIIAFFQTLSIGIKTLTHSSNIALGEDEQFDSKEIIGIIALSLLFVISFFVLVPYIITSVIGFNEATQPVLFNVIDSVIKIAFFLIYVVVIGSLKDVKRVFQYHGAEHKAVNCYEAGKKLTVQNVKKYSTIHARCGTSFIMLVLVVGIVLFTFIAPTVLYFFPTIGGLSLVVQKIIFFTVRILFLLPIASISYEILKLTGAHKENMFLHTINYPGMLFQKLTTQEPDNKQIEVAIVALEKVL
jgi:uncharacterized protein YqhQ